MHNDTPTRIVLIRHGETAWNAERRLQGHLDIDLNEEGQRQARALAAALANEHFDVLVSSDLARASQTAKALGDLTGLPLYIDGRLRERCYGAVEGLRHADIEARFPREYAAWRARERPERLSLGPERFRARPERVSLGPERFRARSERFSS